MIDWEEIAYTENEDKLKAVKQWLFRENVRLDNERRELETAREQLLNDKQNLRKELDELNLRSIQEKKRIKNENMFFEQKMAILQDGFRKLEIDRHILEAQRLELEQQKRRFEFGDKATITISSEGVERLFAGITNPLALRKRYKDLIKIFHPDNLFGDEELVQMINKEYNRRRDEQ